MTFVFCHCLKDSIKFFKLIAKNWKINMNRGRNSKQNDLRVNIDKRRPKINSYIRDQPGRLSTVKQNGKRWAELTKLCSEAKREYFKSKSVYYAATDLVVAERSISEREVLVFLADVEIVHKRTMENVKANNSNARYSRPSTQMNRHVRTNSSSNHANSSNFEVDTVNSSNRIAQSSRSIMKMNRQTLKNRTSNSTSNYGTSKRTSNHQTSQQRHRNYRESEEQNLMQFD